MLRLASYDVVFTEIPGETTLALNLSGCPVRCVDCHSKHLWEDTGEPLTDELLYGLLEVYGASVTCVAFMGGDGEPAEVERLAWLVREWIAPAVLDMLPHVNLADPTKRLKTAWYSGREVFPKGFMATGLISTDSDLLSKSDASAGREVFPKGFMATGSIRIDSDLLSKSDASAGRELLPEGFASDTGGETSAFDYVKLGPYDARLGGLDSPTTNQRLYLHGRDITERMWKR